MKHPSHAGGELRWTVAGTAVTSGQMLQVEDTIVIAHADYAIGAEAVGLTRGHFGGQPCKAADVVNPGARLYWDDTAKELTLTATANVYAGYCTQASAATVTTVGIELVGGGAPDGA